jgi:hypothetical protein
LLTWRLATRLGLKATAGSMNLRVPDGVDLGRYRSIVIWCEITHNAYASAPLRG